MTEEEMLKFERYLEGVRKYGLGHATIKEYHKVAAAWLEVKRLHGSVGETVV
jgi:hypothetical protein